MIRLRTAVEQPVSATGIPLEVECTRAMCPAVYRAEHLHITAEIDVEMDLSQKITLNVELK